MKRRGIRDAREAAIPTKRWFSSEEFSTSAAKGEPVDGGVRKGAAVEVIAGEDRRLTFTISTENPDRERDVINVGGWDFGAFSKNGVVTWAHDYSSPPVARAVRVWTEGAALKATAEFVPREMYPFADMVYQMYQKGFLSAVSVGFKPLEWTYNEERRGIDFKRCELLEFACVPVPANADCLVEARDAGIDVEPLREWAAKTLERLGANGVARAGLTEIITTAAGTTTTRIFGPGFAFIPDDDPAPHAPEIEGAPAAEPKAVPVVDAAEKGSSPSDASTSKAPPDTAWSAPSLSDFTPDQFGDLTASEKRHIAGHYAWAAAMPPESFGDLKLPHHRASDSYVVWRGVAAAAARLNQASIPDGDMGAVKAHLRRHYNAFDMPVPDSLKAQDEADESLRGRLLEVVAAEFTMRAVMTNPAEGQAVG